jgi:hypothetical protein
MPIIVGAIRSGTTLLRLMLDAHSQIAMPPETSFPESIFQKALELSGDSVAELIAAHSKWEDLGIDRDEYIAACRNRSGMEAMRLVWELYGRRQSKPIVGDKSPGYVKFLPVIQRVLPGIRVIHIIRDGRDCFASQMHSRFSLFSKAIRSPGMQASEWCGAVGAGRRFGSLLDAYLEVRYEQLILDPSLALGEICSFIGVSYEPGMVSYHKRAESRLRELGDRLVEGGRQQTGKTRREAFALTRLAPDETRIGRWRETLLPEAVHEYEKIAGGLLTALGYETSTRMLSEHDELSSQTTSERVAAALSRYEYAEAKRLAILAWRAHPNSRARTAKLLTLAEWTQDLPIHWRMEVVGNQGEMKRFGNALPAWNGELLGDARRLLIWKYYRHLGAEIRYAAALSNLGFMGKHCSVEVDPRLVPLLKRRFPEMEFIPRSEHLLGKDVPRSTAFNATWERLGYFLLPSAAAMPNEPWLAADVAKVEQFSRRRFPRSLRPRIALVWHSTNSEKSLPPIEVWRHLLSVRGIEFVSAQQESDPRGIAAWEGLSQRIRKEPVDLRDDLDGLAAVMLSCDLLITISATQAHLAGALGLPVWLVIREQPLLSWPLGDNKTVWYPKTRCVWVREESDWAPTMKMLADELRALRNDRIRRSLKSFLRAESERARG